MYAAWTEKTIVGPMTLVERDGARRYAKRRLSRKLFGSWRNTLRGSAAYLPLRLPPGERFFNGAAGKPLRPSPTEKRAPMSSRRPRPETPGPAVRRVWQTTATRCPFSFRATAWWAKTGRLWGMEVGLGSRKNCLISKTIERAKCYERCSPQNKDRLYAGTLH